MEGARSAWTSAVVTALVRLCHTRSLAVALIEFNHTIISRAAMSCSAAPSAGGAGRASGEPSTPAGASAGASFTKDYAWLSRAAARQWSDGGTDLSLALSTAIRQFGHARHPAAGTASRPRVELRHALIVTDGIPTVGDPVLREERAAAIRLGLCVHTVYVNGADVSAVHSMQPPKVLVDLAHATGGLACCAVVDESNGNVELRAAA